MNRPTLCFTSKDAAIQAGETIGSAIPTLSPKVEKRRAHGDASIYTLSLEEHDEEKVTGLVDQEQFGEFVVRCPSCNSMKIEYPAAPQSSPSMKMVQKVIDNHRTFLCKTCRHSWE